MGDKKSFVMYNEWAAVFRKMNDEQAGKMIKAIYDYQNNENEPEIDDPGLVFLFELFRERFDNDREKYLEECRKNRENGMKGGRPQKPNKTQKTQQNPKNPLGFSETQPNPKNHDNDHDSDNDNTIEKENIKRKKPVFIPPTIDDVKAYCLERNNEVNPESFVSFYESKGWMIGKNKMKDWKAAIRTWENNERASPKADKPEKQKFHNFNERDYDFAALEKRFARN